MLWRSVQFMSGVTLPNNLDYEYWVMTTETQTQNLLQRVVERLADHCSVLNDFENHMRWLHDSGRN